jgi:anti-sigma factor RsiW
MTCRDFADFLSDYLAGELPEDVLAAFEEHIVLCPNCVRYLAQYRDAIAFSRAAFEAGDAPVPDGVPEDLVAAILIARSA